MNNEADFAFRIRQALNEGAERLDYKTQLRLEQARKAALARFDARRGAKRVPATELVLADSAGGTWTWLQRLGLIAPLFVMVIGFAGIYQWREAQRISYLADIDFAVLLDDGPIEAYADQGFGAFIQQERAE
jgi:hypothetical protein